jgi:hypothetical protein
MDNDLKDTIHDCYVDVYGIKPSESVIQRTYELLPDDIKSLAIQWGGYDTEVRDSIYGWMKQKAEVF